MRRDADAALSAGSGDAEEGLGAGIVEGARTRMPVITRRARRSASIRCPRYRVAVSRHRVSDWRVDVERRDGVPRLVPAAEIARLVAASLEAAGAPRPASIGVILSGDAELALLNAEHMGRAEPTDVLSFPLLDPSAFPGHPGKVPSPAPAAGAPGGRFALPPGARPHLGDIVVSVERAVDQAEAGRGGQTGDLRWAARDELRLLVVHGTLHVCGWDHADPVEGAAMRALERSLLA